MIFFLSSSLVSYSSTPAPAAWGVNPESSQQSFFTTGEIFQKLDECQIGPEIHCSSWRCNALQWHAQDWSYPFTLTLDRLPTSTHAERRWRKLTSAQPRFIWIRSKAVFISARWLSLVYFPSSFPFVEFISIPHLARSRSLIQLGNWVFQSLILPSWTLNRNTVYGNDSSISTRKYM